MEKRNEISNDDVRTVGVIPPYEPIPPSRTILHRDGDGDEDGASHPNTEGYDPIFSEY